MKQLIRFTQTEIAAAISGSISSTDVVKKPQLSGIHPIGTPYELPVLNMYEQAFTSYSAIIEANAEVFRGMGSSGVYATRQYTASKAFEPKERTFGTNYAALSIHNHPNYRGMPGMGEFSAFLNGYYIRTRHNDYRLFAPVVSAKYLDRKEILPPAVPEAVLSMPIGEGYGGVTPFAANTQFSYMQNVYTNAPDDCVFYLTYLEAWWETYDDATIGDYTDSFRHFNNVSSTKQMIDKAMFFNAAGHKDRLENHTYNPVIVRKIDEYGVPIIATFQYRINSIPVATLGAATTKTFTYADGTTQDFPLVSLPFNEAKSAAGTIDTTNVFKVRRDLRKKYKGGATRTWATVARESAAIFDLSPALLSKICEMLPGLDGVGANLVETYTQYGYSDVLTKFNKALDLDANKDVLFPYTPAENVLNAAYYNQTYSYVAKDASNRTSSLRGFNDPTLFTARNSQPKCVDKVSYMIPMELILRTPRESWNPHEVPISNTTPTGNGLTSTTAYSHANPNNWNFMLPAELFGPISSDGTDVADTQSSAWVNSPTGVKLLRGSGINVFDYNNNGVVNTGFRKRFPIFHEYHDYSKASSDLALLKQSLNVLLKKVIAGTATVADIDDILT